MTAPDKNQIYYQTNAKHYAAVNDSFNMTQFYNIFLPHISAGGKILDAGCGSGRDSLYFLKQGFQVDAFDASSEMAKIAREKTGLVIRVERFQDLESTHKYDGVWANASLLHVPWQELDGVFYRIYQSLKENGVFYASFKIGNGEQEFSGRRFTLINENDLRSLLMGVPDFKLLSLIKTPDSRSGEYPHWLNFVLKKSK